MASPALPAWDRLGWPFLRRGNLAKSNGRKRVQPLNTVAVGTLVPQSHGGALRNGGSGATGGSLPKVVREALLKSGYNRLPILEQIADDPDVKPEVRMGAVFGMLKTGLGTEGTSIAAAQVETPEGYKFSLVIGERGDTDD